MKLLILCLVIIGVTLGDRCKPKYHFWRPFNGTIPRDAFIAGYDEDGKKNYVAKIIPQDEYLWTIPAQFKEGWDHVDMAWCCNDGNAGRKVMRVDKFIEILCTENPDNLEWRGVKRYADEIASTCCFVQGGVALYGNHIYVSNIGRGTVNGNVFIGRAYLERAWEGVHVMDGNNSTKIFSDFQMLTYDCKANPISLDEKKLTMDEKLSPSDAKEETDVV